MPGDAKEKLGVVGLGYVGLPLAALFATKFEVVGFDIDENRVDELRAGIDRTNEVEDPKHLQNGNLSFTANPEELKDCTFIIVAVPTPINTAREPDLKPVEGASRTVGGILQKGMMVVYESTVYPGVTEDICLKILEEESGLKLGDFDLGYSPERVNPGDKQHTIDKIVKVVSGHNEASLARASAVYGSVITAGIHQAPTIKTAEAAKVIENVQRDLNIALMNELSRIFAKLDIQTRDVLAAAGTKWNFHAYYPGLVGGHCIGVDPYYLTHRALELGYHPEVILAGRRINDSMGNYVGDLTIREINASGKMPKDAHVLIMGITFKENVPDLRNTRAIDVVKFLQGYGVRVSVCEPLVAPGELKRRYGLEHVAFEEARDLDAVILINGHEVFRNISLSDLKSRMRTPILVDVKTFFPRQEALDLGFRYVNL
ncbi:MAG: nucleotide sugar dehydrogenase [Verrucomicrobia bacterium]|nr:nucleotide sugar dehydrogenase [Verrucomicrobiota bacterium]